MLNLEGPERWHVMLSHHGNECGIVTDLSARLRQWRLSCCVVDLATDLRTTENYTWKSRVIIPILTQSYIEESVRGGVWNIIQDKIRIVGQLQRVMGLLLEDLKDIPPVFAGLPVLTYGSPGLVWDLNAVLSRVEFEFMPQPAQSNSTGETLAWSYYYGYLHLVMPKWGEDGMDIQERIRKTKFWKDNPQNRLIPQKVIIIILESCKCPPDVSDLHPGIKPTEYCLNCAAHRSGHPDREYRVPIISVDGDEDNTLYAAGDLSSSVLTFYEMMEDEFCSFDEHEMQIEICKFYYTLNRILKNSGLNLQDKYNIIYVKDNVSGDDIRQLLFDQIYREINNDIRQEQAFGLPRASVQQPAHHLQASLCRTAPTLHAQQEVKYPMNGKPRGIAVIINIPSFTTLRPRAGSEQDEENLVSLMMKLEFTVFCHNNPAQLKKTDLLRLFEDYRLKNYADYKCFVCFILTHGKEGYVLGSDEGEVSIIDIARLFNPDKCPTLKDKPKTFFIQACQGDQTPPDLEYDGIGQVAPPTAPLPTVPPATVPIPETREQATPSNRMDLSDMDPLYHDGALQADVTPEWVTNKKRLYVPDEEDFLMAYATLPGGRAWRDTSSGSLYIKYICEELGKVDSGLDIISILNRVKNKVKGELTERRSNQTERSTRQVPVHLSTLSKRLCFDLQN